MDGAQDEHAVGGDAQLVVIRSDQSKEIGNVLARDANAMKFLLKIAEEGGVPEKGFDFNGWLEKKRAVKSIIKRNGHGGDPSTVTGAPESDMPCAKFFQDIFEPANFKDSLAESMGGAGDIRCDGEFAIEGATWTTRIGVGQMENTRIDAKRIEVSAHLVVSARTDGAPAMLNEEDGSLVDWMSKVKLDPDVIVPLVGGWGGGWEFHPAADRVSEFGETLKGFEGEGKVCGHGKKIVMGPSFPFF